MPFNINISDNPNSPAWKKPDNLSVYDGSWKTVKVGYVYDLGVWRVVFPDPIIPLVNVIDNGSWAEVNTVDRFYVQMILNTSELESMVGELYLGSTATGTPIQTQNFNYSFIFEGYEYYIRFYVPTAATYTIKATATSITGNSVSVVSQPITPIALSVNITSASLTTSSYSVSWNSIGQEEYFVGVGLASGGPITILQQASSTTVRSASGGISPRLLGDTQYRLYVGIRRSGEFLYTQTSVLLTTPVGYNPEITNFTATRTCNSITATWTNNSDVDTIRISISQAVGFDQGNPIYGNTQNFTLAYPQNSKTFSGLLPFNYYNSATAGIYQISIYAEAIDGTETEIQDLYINTLTWSPPNAPTNFSATSDYHGIGVSFSWTASTTNCAEVTGYTIQYKLSSSSTWSLISNTIPSNDTTWSAGGIGTSTFLPGRTYNFRIFARSDAGNSSYSPNISGLSLTMNNNPYSISISGTNSINTFSSSVLTAQLRNAAYENISASGFTITWSFIGGINPPSGSFVNPTLAISNSSGQATTTFSSGSDDGTGTVFATTSNLGPLEQGSRTMTVSLTPGLKPTLSISATTKGVSITNTNHSSLYSYTNTPGYPNTGSLESGDSYNNSQFDILTTLTRTARNTISKSGRTATTTNPTFSGAIVGMAVTSSRLGYTSVSSDQVFAFAGVSITSRSYQWQQFTNSTWNTNFGGAFSGMQTATLSWSNTTFSSRQIRCQVTTNFSNGGSDTATSENTVTIP